MDVLELIRYIIETMETAGEIILFIVAVYAFILLYRGYCRTEKTTQT